MDNVVIMPEHDDNDGCFNNLVRDNYGKIDAEWVMTNLAPTHKTGNTQLAVYDYSTQILLLQYSGNNTDAFLKPALRIRLNGMFSSQYE